MQPGEDTGLRRKLRDIPRPPGPYIRRVHLIDDQVGIAIGEDLVHSIDQRAEWPNRSIHTIHALERNKHATPTLLER